MMLIRYMSLNRGIEAVETGLFKLLRPLNANDPYEMMGACVGRLKPEVQAELLNDMKYEWLKAQLPMSGKVALYPIEEVIARVSNNASYIQKMLMSREVQQELNTMLCFAEAAQIDATADQLMWGHYAGGGTGVRIWFDTDHFPKTLPPLLKVQYQETRPQIDLGTLNSYNDVAAWGQFLMEILTVKSSAWSYEHEQRMLIPSRSAESIVIIRDGMEFVQLGQTCIRRIDFGPKGFQEDTKRRIEELASNPALAHVDFRLATFMGEEYAYEYLGLEELRRIGW